MGLKLPSGLKLQDQALAEFQKKRAEIDAQFATLPLQTQLASRE